jgi:hypothetical protein
MRRRSSMNAAGEFAAGRVHRPGGRDRARQPGRGRRGDRSGDPAGDQIAQHRMQPAHHLGTAPVQVTVAFGPHLQHRRVIIGHGLPDTRRAQRRDGHRPGVIRVVLVRVAGGQQPHPRAELRLDIQYPLSCGQELPGVFAALAVARHLQDATGTSIKKIIQALRTARSATRVGSI